METAKSKYPLLLISFLAGFVSFVVVMLLMVVFLPNHLFLSLIAIAFPYLSLYYLVPGFWKELDIKPQFFLVSLLLFYLGAALSLVAVVWFSLMRFIAHYG